MRNCRYRLPRVTVREHVSALFPPHIIGSNLLCDIVATRRKTASRTWFPWRRSFFFFILLFPSPSIFSFVQPVYTLGSEVRFSLHSTRLSIPIVPVRHFCSHRLLNIYFVECHEIRYRLKIRSYPPRYRERALLRNQKLRTG